MPRKAPAQRKDASGGSTKSSRGASSRRSNRAVNKDDDDANQDAERSRRSSTAAQTAASVAESRVTRSSRSTKRENSSPSRESSKAAEALASRARSSRRSTQNVNYKESDGEEETPASKNEDDFESNEEFDESDSDEKSKKRVRKAKSPQKGRTAKPKSRGRTGKQGYSARKRKISVDEEEETVDLSDESDHEKDSTDAQKEDAESKKGQKTSSSPGSRKARSTAASHPVIDIDDAEEKPSRRSRRASAKSASVIEIPNKRPSRNKQVKKYTEVEEEDFSYAKNEEDDDEYEPEVKKEAAGRKRKRAVEAEPSNKKAKQDFSTDEPEKKSEEDVEHDEKKRTEDTSKGETADDDEHQFSDEPMEIDETVPDEAELPSEESKQSSSEKVEKKEVPCEESTKVKPEESCGELPSPAKISVVSTGEEPKDDGKVPKSEKKENVQPPGAESSKIEKDNTAQAKESNSEANVPTDGKEEEVDQQATPVGPVEPAKKQEVKEVESQSENTTTTSQSHDTFPSTKEPVPLATSVNGEDNKSTVDAASPKDSVVSPSSEPTVFQHQNDTKAPKTNGAQNELDEKTTLSKDSLYVLPNRKHVFNSYISEDLRSSLKEGTFGIVSYNLSTGFINADKLIHELDKLQASIICLQEVSRLFFTETLESKLDVLGYKAITNTPWSDSGLVTFYKSSLFRLCNVVDIPTHTLISEALESSKLEESEKQAVSGCYDKCGNVLITQLASVLSSHAVTVANVRIPPCSLSLNALQVCCVVRKISTMREHIKPVLICGEFNSCETEVPYQLVKSGYLSERMIEELKSRTDGAECVPLIKLLQSKSGVLCCAMFSCYNMVLGKDVELPKPNTARDILWASADNLHIIGVLDSSTDPADSKNDHRISLKADVAFFV